MPAYLIADIQEITDTASYDEYRKHTPGAIAAFGGKFIVRGGKVKCIEGDWTQERLVVVEFPDMAAAERFYNSPEYRKILPLRLKASKGRALLVEGA